VIVRSSVWHESLECIGFTTCPDPTQCSQHLLVLTETFVPGGLMHVKH